MSDLNIRYNVSMAKKRKKKPLVEQISEMLIKKPEEVTFKVFFSWCVITKRLAKHQEAEIYAFFRDQGLKDKEDKDNYLKILEKY